MEKKCIFSKISKYLIIGLVLAAFLSAGKRENKTDNLNFYQIGAQVIRTYFEKQMLYSQSVMAGILLETEDVFWYGKKGIQAEGFLPDYHQEHSLIPEEEMQEKIREENQIATAGNKEEVMLSQNTEFLPATEKVEEIKAEEYRQLEELVKRFYTIDPTTSIEEDYFNFEELKGTDCQVDMEKAGPQILIYHTHSQETFSDSEPGKEEDTIVGAGEVLASYLREYGFDVLHHKGKYDVEKRDYAYSNALPEIEKLLKENPQIQVVIDLHRDAVAEGTKLVTQLQGKQTAKVMFFNGLGRSKEQGEISYLKNPYLKENLAFSFQMKLACDEYYPGFARNIYLRAYRYNMHLCPKTLLIELGAQTNTKEEIHNALVPLAHALYMVLSNSTASD